MGHKGRCFRDRRRTRARKLRQGVIAQMEQYADLATTAGFFKTRASAIALAPLFDIAFFEWVLRQRPGIVQKRRGRIGVLHPESGTAPQATTLIAAETQ